MSIVTIGFGLALMALATVAFLPTHAYTALIPGYFGIALCIFGFLGVVNAKLRMHAMHGAVLISLVGFLIPAYRVAVAIPGAISAGAFRHADGSDASVGFATQLAMALICAVHVGLCVKSFIGARRRRKEQIPTH